MKTFFMAGAVRAAIFCPTTVEPVNETMRTWWLDLPLPRGRVWASLGDAEAYLIFVIFFTQAKFLENKICTEIYTANCQFTQ